MAALLGGDTAAAAAGDATLAAMMAVIRAHPVLGDFGVYQSVMELAPGWEVFTPSPQATPTLGAAGATTISPTVIVKSYAAFDADPAQLDAALAAIMAAHPWETPVVELVEAALLTR
nr:hypothetical protein [Sphingomonas jinjuensis]